MKSALLVIRCARSRNAQMPVRGHSSSKNNSELSRNTASINRGFIYTPFRELHRPIGSKLVSNLVPLEMFAARLIYCGHSERIWTLRGISAPARNTEIEEEFALRNASNGKTSSYMAFLRAGQL